MNLREAKRFHRHYKFMEGVPPHGIMMSYLYGTMDENRVADFHTGCIPKRQDASCGSAACVAGWLPASLPRIFEVEDGGSIRLKKSSPFYRHNNSRSWLFATKLIFGIDDIHRDYACDPACYPIAPGGSEPSKREVLTHMRRVAKAYGWDITGDEPVQVKPKPIAEIPELMEAMGYV